MYQAQCSCGFTSDELLIGAGLGGGYNIPVACSTCHRVWVQDIKKGRKKCRKCKSPIYHLLQPPSSIVDAYACDFAPPMTCPKCGKNELTLEECGMWD